MGEELVRNDGTVTGENESSINAGGTGGTGTGRGRKRSGQTGGNSGTAAAGTGAGAGGTGAGTAEEKKPAEMVAVADTVPAPEVPKKKQTRKKNTKKNNKKKEPEQFSADQISALIMTASSIVASRPDMMVWQLQQEECDQLAKPISNMIAKSEKLANMGEYADGIALVTASIMIFAPRFMIYGEQKKQKKLQAAGGVKIVRKETKSAGNAGKPAGTGTADAKEYAEAISSAIPATIF